MRGYPVGQQRYTNRLESTKRNLTYRGLFLSIRPSLNKVARIYAHFFFCFSLSFLFPKLDKHNIFSPSRSRNISQSTKSIVIMKRNETGSISFGVGQYRAGRLQSDVHFVDVGPVLGDVAGHLPSGERDVDTLSGLEGEAGRRLETGPDQIHFRVFAQLLPVAVLLCCWPAASHRPVHDAADGVLGDGDGLAFGRVHFGRLHRLDDAYKIGSSGTRLDT